MSSIHASLTSSKRAMNRPPEWNRGDTLRSVRDVAVIGFGALKECIIDAADWLDTKFADRINGADDV